MADFSKQWCELNDPEMPWDFDILEEAAKLDNGYLTGLICEGFGFIGIAKNSEGDIKLAFGEGGTDQVIWKSYDEVINNQNK